MVPSPTSFPIYPNYFPFFTLSPNLYFSFYFLSPLLDPPPLSLGTGAGAPVMETLRALSGILVLALVAAMQAAAAEAATSAYDALREHGLPAGLLPKGVRDFTVDADGRFQALLPGPCIATFETEVQYDANITGTLSYGQISGLSGVAVQELFLWFSVRTIRVDIPSSGLIYFDVGVIKKQFSLSLFESPPDCTPVSSTDPRSYSDDRFGLADA